MKKEIPGNIAEFFSVIAPGAIVCIAILRIGGIEATSYLNLNKLNWADSVISALLLLILSYVTGSLLLQFSSPYGRLVYYGLFPKFRKVGLKAARKRTELARSKIDPVKLTYDCDMPLSIWASTFITLNSEGGAQEIYQIEESYKLFRSLGLVFSIVLIADCAELVVDTQEVMRHWWHICLSLFFLVLFTSRFMYLRRWYAKRLFQLLPLIVMQKLPSEHVPVPTQRAKMEQNC